MKPRKFNPVVLVPWILLIGVAIWWFMQPAAPVPQKAVATPASIATKPDAPKSDTHTAQVVAPVVRPVQPTASASATDVDPQADLKTAIPDIIRLRRAGYYVVFAQTYTPPDKLTPELIQNAQKMEDDLKKLQDMASKVTDPNERQRAIEGVDRLHDVAVMAFNGLENQTPTYNAAGDEATFLPSLPFNDLNGEPMRITFIKINGKWYIKPRELALHENP